MTNIEIRGANEVIERFESLRDAEGLRRALGKACALVERSAKEKAPKTANSTGDLRRSIKSRIEEDGSDLVGIVYTPLEYAPYVEFGTGLFAEEGGRMDVPWHYMDDKGEWHSTSGMKPQPFMRPALEENREQIIRLFKEGLEND